MAKKKNNFEEKEKDDNGSSPLKKFIQIQDMQLKLDKLKQEKAKMVTEIRSLSQTIPKMIRELSLR